MLDLQAQAMLQQQAHSENGTQVQRCCLPPENTLTEVTTFELEACQQPELVYHR